MNRTPIIPLLLGLVATVAHGQQSARIVKYHANDIVSVHAKMRYTTLIELPSTEKILEVATGDKDFWIIDTVGNYCFLHPAKEGIQSNLNLITDKGTVYSFTLDDTGSADPDLKVAIRPFLACRRQRRHQARFDNGSGRRPRPGAGRPVPCHGSCRTVPR
jgi:type IV secretion system protein VirB9